MYPSFKDPNRFPQNENCYVKDEYTLVALTIDILISEKLRIKLKRSLTFSRIEVNRWVNTENDKESINKAKGLFEELNILQ